MSYPEPPRRRPSRTEYNIRRAIALLLVLLLFTGLFRLVNLITSGLQEKMNPAPSVSTSPSTKQTKPNGQVVACPDSDISVTLSISADTPIVAGEGTQLIMQFSNTSNQRCLRDVGATANEIYVQNESGKKIWSTDTCPVADRVHLVKLWPGDVYQVSVNWPGTKNPPKCKVAAEPVQPGQYTIIARNAGAKSEPAAITVK